jgi:hypothetical protein
LYLPGETIVTNAHVQFEVIVIPVMFKSWLVSIQVRVTDALSPQARVSLVAEGVTEVAIACTVTVIVII